MNHKNRGRTSITANTTTKTSTMKKRLPARTRADHDRDYETLRRVVALNLSGTAPLFQTDVTDLFETFLDNVPGERNIHNCNCCRSFVKHYGGLVTIDATTGTQSSAMWLDRKKVPQFYWSAMQAMAKRIESAKVTGPFLSADQTWGTPRTGAWEHFHTKRLPQHVYNGALLTAGQAMAGLRHNFETVTRALGEFSPAVLTKAKQLLEADALSRSEKFIGPVQWLLDLHSSRHRLDGRRRANLLWLAIAKAPEGYCHPRASVIGSLLEDLITDMPIAKVQKRFAEKLHPLQYQRPTAAPKAGTIVQAEKVVDQLGIRASLDRRFARLDECVTIWTPRQKKAAPSRSGTFGHIAARGERTGPPTVMPGRTMTWAKFAAEVMPTAEKIEMRTPRGNGNFMAYLTAANADAPVIHKWGHHVSYYVYHGGSPAQQWGLSPDSWVDVTAISPFPAVWNEGNRHLGDGVLFVLRDAKDTRTDQGNALFPETLKSDLHSVRAVIEAYSKTAQITGRADASACGLAFSVGAKPAYRLNVTAGDTVTEITLDRWD